METPFLGNRRSHMSTSNTSKHPSQRRYPPELRERAVRMVREAIAEDGDSFGVVTRVGRQLGIGVESLRNWVKQAEVDDGRRPGIELPWVRWRLHFLGIEGVTCPHRTRASTPASGGTRLSCGSARSAWYARRSPKMATASAWSPGWAVSWGLGSSRCATGSSKRRSTTDGVR